MGVESFPAIAEDIGKTQMNFVGSDPWRLDTETVTSFYRDRREMADKVSDRLRRFDFGIKEMKVTPLPDSTRRKMALGLRTSWH